MRSKYLLHIYSCSSELVFSQPDSPTEGSTNNLSSGQDGGKSSEGEERVSRSRRSSRTQSTDKPHPPRPCSVPRRSIPRRMSSLEERPPVTNYFQILTTYI